MGTVTGTVGFKKVAIGSKSEREAVTITVGSDEYILRVRGENPFECTKSKKLVGKTIEGEGALNGNTYIIWSWRIL